MKNFIKSFFVVTFLLVFSFTEKTQAQANGLTSKNIPPCDTAYDIEYLGFMHAKYGNLLDLTNPFHYAFSNCYVPPSVIAQAMIDSFGSMTQATVHVFGGPTFVMTAPAQCMVQVTMTGQTGNTSYYDNEMLMLNISGGNLPAGYKIRLSPSHASTGQTTITDVGGLYNITSYFDVWTEISIDNGMTWIPGDTCGRMTLHDYPLNIKKPEVIKDGYTVLANPVTDNLLIDIYKSSAGVFEIIDLTGKILSSTSVSDAVHELTLDTKNLSSGLYFIRWKSNNGIVIPKKFVKQ